MMQLAFWHRSETEKNEWATPPQLFRELDREFGFTIDVCASDWNTKCKRYWTKEDDGLEQDWSGEICWMNPPYGAELPHWMHKAYSESLRGATVVCLVPVTADLAWWHEYALKGEIRWIRGRVQYLLPDRKPTAAPFPSCIVIFRA